MQKHIVAIILIAFSALLLSSCGTNFNGSQTNTYAPQWFDYNGGESVGLDVQRYFSKRLTEAGKGERSEDKLYDPRSKTGTLIVDGKHYTLKEITPSHLVIEFYAPQGCAGAQSGRIQIKNDAGYCTSCCKIQYYPQDLAVSTRLDEVWKEVQTWYERAGFGLLIPEESNDIQWFNKFF